LKELRDELHHMDEQELLAFGRKLRSMPHSDEMKEASATPQADSERNELEPPMDSLTSEDFTKMAAVADRAATRGYATKTEFKNCPSRANLPP
jgi:hypothetical protein